MKDAEGQFPAGAVHTRSRTVKGLTILPANEASWEDLELVLRPVKCHSVRCYCQRFKIPGSQWNLVDDDERAYLLRIQTDCEKPESGTTSGLVAYLDGQPVGWCAIEPRTAYPNLLTNRMPWTGRDEDKADDGVWAITCFIVRTGYRKRGITYDLARAAVDFAKQRGARAVEGYAMITTPEKEITWGELHVGSRNVFEAAGFREVTRPSKRRVVMRLDF
ncbi:GNAT family N-acetyltransferase [Paenibacillus sp. CF384]|uniref:GNAT family N-acetyltransferase n=1 Tax=Paenibacillus sp. CF384 TaxID=1884382 RepID=UPI00089A8B50|nr:GNAT family N-acetyltransferase [Paenibacillus sp. CF384]SDW03381.1 Acetyltransferase (GNAT) family protein [Paenibacillus sp. CF384]